MTWQAEQEGEARLLAPEFERLSALHGAAWGTICAGHRRSAGPIARSMRPRRRGSPAGVSAVGPSLMPQRISVSALASLVACPYQFFVRSVLRLGELDEVSEELEKSDYGALVHSFARALPPSLPRRFRAVTGDGAGRARCDRLRVLCSGRGGQLARGRLALALAAASWRLSRVAAPL